MIPYFFGSTYYCMHMKIYSSVIAFIILQKKMNFYFARFPKEGVHKYYLYQEANSYILLYQEVNSYILLYQEAISYILFIPRSECINTIYTKK